MKSLVFGFVAACAVVAFGNVWDPVQIKGTTDRDPLTYKPGEEMKFTLSLQGAEKVADGEYFVAWNRFGDDGQTTGGKVDVNKLPLAFDIAWYEQKAVAVLLALLSLGFRNIRLGPTLPAFVSTGVARTLVERFGLCGIGSVGGDIKSIMG